MKAEDKLDKFESFLEFQDPQERDRKSTQ